MTYANTPPMPDAARTPREIDISHHAGTPGSNISERQLFEEMMSGPIILHSATGTKQVDIHPSALWVEIGGLKELAEEIFVQASASEDPESELDYQLQCAEVALLDLRRVYEYFCALKEDRLVETDEDNDQPASYHPPAAVS